MLCSLKLLCDHKVLILVKMCLLKMYEVLGLVTIKGGTHICIINKKCRFYNIIYIIDIKHVEILERNIFQNSI